MDERQGNSSGSQPTLKELAAESSRDETTSPPLPVESAPAGAAPAAPGAPEAPAARSAAALPDRSGARPPRPQANTAEQAARNGQRPAAQAPWSIVELSKAQRPQRPSSPSPSRLPELERPAPPVVPVDEAPAGTAAGAAEEMDTSPGRNSGTASGPAGAAGGEDEPTSRPAEPDTLASPPPARSAGEAAPRARGAAPASADLDGSSWELHNTIDSTKNSSYRGLRLTYRITLRQEGKRVVGDGEKLAENGRRIPAAQRTQIHVAGELVGRELRLVFTERGLWRGSGGNFRWRLSADGTSLAGTFASNVADSRGSSDASRVP